MKQLAVVVLAAGEGKRMHSDLPKVLHPLCGRPMLRYVLESASPLTDRIFIVVGHGAAQVKETMGPDWRYVFQEKQLGTGHALLQAMPALPDSGNLLVLCGDTPLLQSGCLQEMLDGHLPGGATVMTARAPDPSGYGRIIRDSRGGLESIIEESEATPEQKAITEINTGVYCFDLKLLSLLLPMLEEKNVQGEYYLTDIIPLVKKYGYPVQAYQLSDYRVGMGINDRYLLSEAAVICRERINRALMMAGVTIIDPRSTFIDYGVKVGQDTVIQPDTIIEGATTIGARCRIGPAVHLRRTVVGDEVTIRNSVVENSVIDSQVMIGPFSYIRPDCHLGRKVKIGDFVEVKNSAIGEKTKVPHLSYVGDSDIGEGVNIGAGVIVANFDGQCKHRCVIESGAFIGCNSNLVSPLNVGKGAFIAAGSTITKNIPARSLALARARQKVYRDQAARLLGRKGPQDTNSRCIQDKNDG